MIDLPAHVITELPVDQLGLAILADVVATGEWHEGNYFNGARKQYSGEALVALAEAMAWLRARALVARDPSKQADGAIVVTRTGHRVLEDGPESFRAQERVQGGIHPEIEAVVRPQFLIGQYELGVFAAMRTVEIRVRAIGGFGAEDIGVDLMNKAFGSSGRLIDPNEPAGEREGRRALFAGAYAVLRNPSGHREVNYDDVAEAAEAVHLASLLMRVLDRIQPSPPATP